MATAIVEIHVPSDVEIPDRGEGDGMVEWRAQTCCERIHRCWGSFPSGVPVRLLGILLIVCFLAAEVSAGNFHLPTHKCSNGTHSYFGESSGNNADDARLNATSPSPVPPTVADTRLIAILLFRIFREDLPTVRKVSAAPSVLRSPPSALN